MSRAVRTQFPSIKLEAETKNTVKRKQIIKACCDKDFINAICECCWNIVNQRVKLTPVTRTKLSKHKKLLRDLSNRSISIKKRRGVSCRVEDLLPYYLF